jgi:hypothetical protein
MTEEEKLKYTFDFRIVFYGNMPSYHGQRKQTGKNIFHRPDPKVNPLWTLSWEFAWPQD